MDTQFKIKSLNSIIQQPDKTLKECLDSPVEITGGDQPYIIMTKEFLRRMLADARQASHLDKILQNMRNEGDVSEEKVMEILEGAIY